MPDQPTKTTATFTPELAQTIAAFVRNEVRKSDGIPVSLIGGRIPYRERCWAKITGNTTVENDDSETIAQHSWTEWRWNYSTLKWEETPEGRSGTTTFGYVINELGTKYKIDTDTFCEIVKGEDQTTGENFWVRPQNPYDTFICTLTETGGESGEGSGGTASWVYTLKSPAGLTWEEGTDEGGLSPDWRVWGGSANDATKGLAYLDLDGNMKLSIAYETIITGSACDPDCS